jgi:hypothetical protein
MKETSHSLKQLQLTLLHQFILKQSLVVVIQRLLDGGLRVTARLCATCAGERLALDDPEFLAIVKTGEQKQVNITSPDSMQPSSSTTVFKSLLLKLLCLNYSKVTKTVNRKNKAHTLPSGIYLRQQ